MTKKVINHASKIMSHEYGGGHVMVAGGLHCVYNSHQALYTMENPGVPMTKANDAISDSLGGVLKALLGNYHILYLPSLKEVKKGVREASGGKYGQRVIYTPAGQEFHLNARYLAEAMDALSTDVCYYLDDKHPVFLCQKGDINASIIEAILPIGTYHKKLDTFVAG